MTALSTRSSATAFSAVRFLAIVAAVFSVFTFSLSAEEAAGAATAVEKAAAPAHHGLPADAPEVFESGFINNSMVVTWIVALVIIVFAQRATRKIRASKEAALEVPAGAQNFAEFLVEGLRDFLEGIIGRDLAKKTFWFFATVFIFILFTNWAGLIPGVGTVGWGTYDAENHFHLTTPLFRGGNADLNMTFAIASIFFVCWTVWAFSANGVGGFILHIFGNPARKEMAGAMKFGMAAIFVVVGLIEVISILFRPVSLSFRLYGNVFAGENLLESMQAVYWPLAWLTPLPFYFMELLVGLVQALVFMLLTAVFTLLICSHGDEDHSHADHGDAAKGGAH